LKNDKRLQLLYGKMLAKGAARVRGEELDWLHPGMNDDDVNPLKLLHR
jgi:hypothetical protein